METSLFDMTPTVDGTVGGHLNVNGRTAADWARANGHIVRSLYYATSITIDLLQAFWTLCQMLFLDFQKFLKMLHCCRIIKQFGLILGVS